ncbi:MAG: hypothetical protein R3A12_20395 [Ignavibacteria bacterium]
MHNLYGPTEAAIEVTYWEMPRDYKKNEIVPIGKAISNTSMYILNSEDELVRRWNRTASYRQNTGCKRLSESS